MTDCTDLFYIIGTVFGKISLFYNTKVLVFFCKVALEGLDVSNTSHYKVMKDKTYLTLYSFTNKNVQARIYTKCRKWATSISISLLSAFNFYPLMVILP